MYQLIKPSRNRQKRGFVLVLLVGAVALTAVMGALAVDRSFLTYQRVRAQEAADMDALATGWLLARDGGTTASSTAQTNDEAEGTAIAADNGFTVASSTYPYNDGSHVKVAVSQTEPSFFSGIVGYHNLYVKAWATAIFSGNKRLIQPSTEMGYIHGEGFNYAAYGPDQGAARGDKIDVRWMGLSGDPNVGVANPWFGTNSKSTGPFGPDDFPYGSVYEFDVPLTYTSAAGGHLIDFEIYDPDLYDNGVDAHGTFDETNHGSSPTEDWLYSLWNGIPGQSTSILIAQAIYGPNITNASPTGVDDEPNTNDHWVTPTGFEFDLGTYAGHTVGGSTINYSLLDSTKNSANMYTQTVAGVSTTWSTFYISVQTSNDTKVNGVYPTGNPTYYGTGLNENGYLVRAGNPHDSLNLESITQANSTTTPTNIYSTNTTNLTDYGVGSSNSPKTATRVDLMDPYALIGKNSVPTGGTIGESWDSYWEATYGGPISNIVFAIDTPMSINANETSGTATVPIYFGYSAANPNTAGQTAFGFWGWDEDSGATSIVYEDYNNSSYTGSPVTTYTGKLGGNELWGGTSQSGDLDNITGYAPGYWVAQYTTGPGDNTTWYMTDNFDVEAGAYVNLVSESSTAVY